MESICRCCFAAELFPPPSLHFSYNICSIISSLFSFPPLSVTHGEKKSHFLPPPLFPGKTTEQQHDSPPAAPYLQLSFFPARRSQRNVSAEKERPSLWVGSDIFLSPSLSGRSRKINVVQHHSDFAWGEREVRLNFFPGLRS